MVALIGGRLFCQQGGRSFPDRCIAASYPLLGVVVAHSAIQAVLDGPYRSHWNAVRLTPPLSLVSGYTLYYGAESGPVTGNIYVPFATMAYLPAAVASTPTGALRLGT